MSNIKEVAQQVENDDEGIVVPIVQRNGKPYLAADGSKSTITVIGSESKRYRKSRDAIWRKAAESSADEDAAAARIAVAAGAVTAWHGWENGDAEALPCTPENVRALLTVEHILVRVEAGIQRRTDFFTDGSSG